MWVIYSLLTALFFATSDALTKKALASRDEYYVAWARLVFTFPVLLLLLLFIEIPPLNRTFWLATFIAIPLEIFAIVLYTKALKVSPISLTMPFLALTPLFLIVISYIILGEKVSLAGGLGIFLIASGSYILNIHKARERLLEPFKAIIAERGTAMMITVAFIYSITSSLGKMAIENSSPIFFGSIYFLLVTIFFTLMIFIRNRGLFKIKKHDMRPLLSIGFTYSLMIIFHMIALSLTKVAYMISIKRMSLLFSIFYGYILFKEQKILERTIGGLIMLVGFVMIVLSK
jgi:drug/metabolite transporter (DMT)-like permease